MTPALDRLALKLVIGLGCLLLLALLVQDRNRWKAKTAHYAQLLAGERAAFSATVTNYRAAADQAYNQKMGLNTEQYVALQAIQMQRDVCAKGGCTPGSSSPRSTNRRSWSKRSCIDRS